MKAMAIVDLERKEAELPALVKSSILCTQAGCNRMRMLGERFCDDCYSEIHALDDLWSGGREYTADPAYAARQSERDERMRRFIVVLLFMMAGEGLLGFAFDLPITWAWLLVNLGWALLIAALAGWFCARRDDE